MEDCTERLMSLKLSRSYQSGRSLRHSHDQQDKGDTREQASDGREAPPSAGAGSSHRAAARRAPDLGDVISDASGLAVAVGRVVLGEPAPTDGPEIFVGRRVPPRGKDGDDDDQ